MQAYLLPHKSAHPPTTLEVQLENYIRNGSTFDQDDEGAYQDDVGPCGVERRSKLDGLSGSIKNGLDQRHTVRNQGRNNFQLHLTSRLHNQTIFIPNLLYIYDGSPARCNTKENISLLRCYLKDWYNDFVPTEKERSKQMKIDLALCTGYFYTNARLEKLKTMGALMAWLFFWDDEIDCGIYSNDHERARIYCDDSIAYVKHTLTPELQANSPAPGRHHNCGAFVEIGKVMATQSLDDRGRLTSAITALITATRDGNIRPKSRLPSIEEYVEHRINTIGTVYMCHSMAWAYDLKLPEWVWNHEATKRMIREVAIGVALANDIISLPKELKEGQVESIVPVMVHHLGLSAQQAVDEAIAMITVSHIDFKAATQQLRLTVADETEALQIDIETWISALMDILVGSMVCQLQCPRYLPRSAFDEDGQGFSVVL